MDKLSEHELAQLPPQVRTEYEAALAAEGANAAPLPTGTVSTPHAVTVDANGMPISAPVDASGTQDPQPENWEQKYKALQGKVRAQARTLKEDQHRSEVLEEAIALLKANGGGEAPVAESTPDPWSVDLDSFRDELGDDVVDMQKKTMTPLMDEIKRLNASIKELEAGSAHSAQDRFDTAVAASVPDWESIWETDEFQAFLDEHDDVSDATYREIIGAACRNFNAKHAISVFARFRGASSPTGAAPTDAAAARARAVASQAMPAGNAPGAQPFNPGMTMTLDQYNDAVQKVVNDMTLGPVERDNKLNQLIEHARKYKLPREAT